MTDNAKLERRKERLWEAMKTKEAREQFESLVENLVCQGFLNIDFYFNNEKHKMQIESRNLVNISLLTLAWEEFLVTQFSYGFVFYDNNIVYWTDIGFRYTDYKGGSNFTKIATMEFNEDYEWSIKPCKGE
ncbi:MAG TPA: hypothetical protein PKK80_02930 [Bacilli bacterium]|nr:hypothetical protein [Bacilli bacterium]